MKNNKTTYFIYALSLSCFGILVFLMFDLSKTIDELAISLIEQKKEQTVNELDNFFEPITTNINVTIERSKTGSYDSTGLSEFNKHFIPFLKESPTISSMMLANQNGDEFMLLEQDSLWINRITKKGSVESEPIRNQWRFENGELTLLKEWQDTKLYDPKTRPWYSEAIDKIQINWTEPYTFFTTKEPGITASKKWIDKNGQSRVFGFDVLLLDISKFTSNLKISDNGKVFILTEDDKALGLPYDQKFQDLDSLTLNILKPTEELGISSLNLAKSKWNENNNTKECFSFESSDGEKWWGSIVDYKLGNNTFHIGVIAPESDFLSAIENTRMLILGGFFVIFLFTIIIIRTNKRIRKANAELSQKNVEIKKQRDLADEQKLLIEEKNNEILDSIVYAKRIQSAILPPTKMVKEYLYESFVLYKPKDIVAGDFYWMNPTEDAVLFAAADCTGHGVPGAMVSVVCNNGLNRSVREYGLYDPGKILDKTREIVISEFEKSEEEVKDGMDVALCSLNGKQLKFAGAHNPLWIIRKGTEEIEEIKANKQPIGKYDNLESYTTHTIKLNEGDSFYIFSDGYADQFGGERGKKFKSKRFKELLISIKDKPMEEQRSLLDDAFEEWKGNLEQLDDVCVIGVKV